MDDGNENGRQQGILSFVTITPESNILLKRENLTCDFLTKGDIIFMRYMWGIYLLIWSSYSQSAVFKISITFTTSIIAPSTLRRPKGIIIVRREIKEDEDACKIVKETLSSSRWKDLENDRNIFETI